MDDWLQEALNTPGMSKEETAREWQRLVTMDVNTAEHMLSFYPAPLEVICFHSQQAVEKCLKGLLVVNDVRPPKIHDLLKLIELCIPLVPGIATFKSHCTVLNVYGVIPRYPHEKPVTEETARNAVVYAKEVVSFAKPLFPAGTAGAAGTEGAPA